LAASNVEGLTVRVDLAAIRGNLAVVRALAVDRIVMACISVRSLISLPRRSA
jgi:hypothetical protein